MMNKKTIRTLTVSALVLALSTVPMFAVGRDGTHNMEKCDRETNNYQAMGTVTAINTADSTLTLKDTDGKDVIVHTNPLTIIKLSGNMAKTMELSNLKTGDWVAVNTFKTDTTTLEAKHIFIIRN